MTTIRTPALIDQPRNAGTYDGLTAAVPIGVARVGCAIQRKNWSKFGGKDVVSLSLEISDDKGRTWTQVGGCTAAAGDTFDRFGNPANETRIISRLPRQYLSHAGLLARVVLLPLARIEGAVDLILDDTPVAISPVGHRSVGYDSDGETTGENVTSLTISSLVVANNADRAMLVGAYSFGSPNSNSVVSSVTWNGSGTGWAAVTSIIDSFDGRVSLWEKVAPAATTANVVVTYAGTAIECGINALSAYSVDQTDPTQGSEVTASGANSSITNNVTSATGELVYDIAYAWNGTNPAGTVGANQTQRAQIAVNAAARLFASTEPGAATTTMSWSPTVDFSGWAQCAVALHEAATGASIVPRLMHQFRQRRM